LAETLPLAHGDQVLDLVHLHFELLLRFLQALLRRHETADQASDRAHDHANWATGRTECGNCRPGTPALHRATERTHKRVSGLKAHREATETSAEQAHRGLTDSSLLPALRAGGCIARHVAKLQNAAFNASLRTCARALDGACCHGLLDGA